MLGSNGVAPSKIRRALNEHTAEQEATLARIIGETVALHLAQVLPQALAGLPWNPGCVLCVQAAKQAEQEWQVAVANAQAAAEEPPPPPQVAVQQAVTWMPLGQPGQAPVVLPVCYVHFQAGPEVRPTGLVLPDGRPIIVKR